MCMYVCMCVIRATIQAPWGDGSTFEVTTAFIEPGEEEEEEDGEGGSGSGESGSGSGESGSRESEISVNVAHADNRRRSHAQDAEERVSRVSQGLCL